MSVQNQYDDNGYKNWLRACLGLKYLKEGITDFIDAEVKQLHATIIRHITNVCGQRLCNQCTTNAIMMKKHRCPDKVCDLIRQEIERVHRFSRPCWQNTDATKWYFDYWEIGKCFMPPGYATKSTAAETDCAGLLSICINGLFLPPTLRGHIILPLNPGAPTACIFHKNREARNNLLHSGSMSLSDAERQAYIQNMITLLTSYKMPIDQVTQDAIDRLTQLNTNIFITSNDELGVLKTTIEDIRNAQYDVQTAINKIGKSIAEDKHDASNEIGALKNQLDCSKTAIQDTKSELGVLKSHMHASQILMYSEKHSNDLLEAKVAKIENMQQDLKIDTENQGTQHKNDTVRVEAQIKNNASLLARVGHKLDLIQCNMEESVTEMKTAYKALQLKNESQSKDLQDIKSRIEAHIVSHEVRIGELEDGMTEIRKDLHATREVMSQTNTACDKEQQIQDVKDYLVAKYKRDELTIPMSPLLRRISANVDDVYMELTIRDDLVHKLRDQTKNTDRKKGDSVTCYQDVLYDNRVSCKNIFIVGKAGVGKTTWSRKFLATWVRAIEGRSTLDVPNENETFLQEYTLVFYVSLRHARRDTHIIEMIEHQLFPHAPDLLSLAKAMLNNPDASSRCIVLMDGLDEWCSHDNISSSDGLPLRDPRWQTTFITTTRSWKLEALQLEADHIDRAVEIHGLQHSAVEKLISHVVSTLNKTTGANKDADGFRYQSNALLKDCMTVPLLLIMFVCLWYETDEISTHLAELYGGLVNLLIQYAEGDTKTRLFQKLVPRKLNEMKRTWKEEKCSVPDYLHAKSLLVTYMPFLLRLGKLAFDTLFADSKEFTLVFDYRSIENVLLEDELDLAVNIGLVSQTMQPVAVLKHEFTLSFLHKTVQEYLAALYMVCGDHKSDCLNRYKTYCENSLLNVLEMENVLLLLSGLCPEMAGEIQCHIADLQPHEKVRKLFVRCLKEEHILSTCLNTVTSNRNILYVISIEKSSDSCDSNKTQHVLRKNREDGEATNSRSSSESESNISVCRTVKKLIFIMSSGTKSEAIDSLNKIAICHYHPSTEIELDNSEQKVLRTVQYQQTLRSLWVQGESLGEITILCYNPTNMSVLDMSGCTEIRKLVYYESSAAIKLPTENLEEVVLQHYNPSIISELDMSECKVLRKLEYRWSSAAIKLPTENLEEVTIQGFDQWDITIIDVSKGDSYGTLEQLPAYMTPKPPRQSEDRLPDTSEDRLPRQSEDRLPDTSEDRLPEPPVDILARQSEDRLSDTPEDRLPDTPEDRLPEPPEDRLPEPSEDRLPDASEDRLPDTPEDRLPDTPEDRLPEPSEDRLPEPPEDILPDTLEDRLPDTLEDILKLSDDFLIPIEGAIFHITEEEVRRAIADLERFLNMSRCKVLRKIEYLHSTVPLELPNESLEEVVINKYNPKSVLVLDMSGCKVLRRLLYLWSSITIRLPTESLEEVTIQGYTPSTESVLDMSGCTVLKKLQYWQSSMTLRLPTESLEEIYILDYIPSSESVLDLSGCKVLRKLSYWRSSIAIKLPTETLEEVEIVSYSPRLESMLDLSRCKVLKKINFNITSPLSPFGIRNISVAIRLPTETLEEVIISGYNPTTESVLDLSGCKVLRKLEYMASSIAIQLPTESLEEINMMEYNPNTESVLDMSGCKILKRLTYTICTASLRLPTEGLEEVCITIYNPSTGSTLDMAGCKALRKLEYKLSSTAIRLPTESLEKVVLENYKPSTESVLDMSGCKILRKLEYIYSSIAIRLPTESLEEAIIHGYRPSTESVLDMSGCKVLRKLEYHDSSITIRVPTESLEEAIIDYQNAESALDISECKVLRKLKYRRKSKSRITAMRLNCPQYQYQYRYDDHVITASPECTVRTNYR